MPPTKLPELEGVFVAGDWVRQVGGTGGGTCLALLLPACLHN
jgi:hypothetical protein